MHSAPVMPAQFAEAESRSGRQHRPLAPNSNPPFDQLPHRPFDAVAPGEVVRVAEFADQVAEPQRGRVSLDYVRENRPLGLLILPALVADLALSCIGSFHLLVLGPMRCSRSAPAACHLQAADSPYRRAEFAST